ECPISVCSGRVSDTIQLMVRRVGRVTKALFQLKEGDWVGLRGPFGKGFPVEHFRSQNLCLIAGGLGIAPIRSLWQYVLDHREEFGRLILVYGMKHSEDLLFGQELRLLMQRRDVEVFLAAEDTNVCLLPAVSMPVGRVTNLIELAALDSSFSAAVCGPPVMYRFVVESLNKRGITDDRIWLSLERHMKCGMGKCGHCFMGGKFICQAGPVMQLNELHLTPEVVELVER
ncbi:MAG TPA: FAD/NAD(P)-binding protein, partial [Chroococcales cyanobacterium]